MGVCDSIAGDGTAAASAVHDPEAKGSAGKPEDGGQKAERNISLPLLARALVRDIRPVENGTAVKRADELSGVSVLP